MVATIYNTSLLVKKSDTSVDVKIYIKNVTEKGREGPGSFFYVDIYSWDRPNGAVVMTSHTTPVFM